jgi:integrase
VATFRKRGRGYQLIYQVDGERRFETIYARNDTEAQRELDIRVGQALEGRAPSAAARRLQFDDLAADLQNEWKTAGRRDLKSLPSRTAHLKRFFAGRPALGITTADVRAYTVARQAEGAANGTINRELAAMKRMFNLAFQAERINRKPYIPLLAESAPRKGFFDAEPFTRVLAALPNHLRPVAEFAYYTGWRRSEVTSLRWEQVDLRERSIRLWTGTTKNGEGRFLPLDGELWRIIEEQRKTPVVGCPFVFHRRGRRIGTFYKAWSEACAEAQCPGMLFHDFRRTAARNLTRDGLSESQAMKITGHKTVSVFRRYNIGTESELAEAVRAKRVFAGKSVPEVCQAVENAKALAPPMLDNRSRNQ